MAKSIPKRQVSVETRKKMSEARKGKPSPNKGKKYPPEIAAKLRKFPMGNIPWNKGKKHPAVSGEKHHLWKGGRSKGYKTGYGSAEYKRWRTEVFLRDDFTCQDCKITGVYITAHHIKAFAHYPDLRFDIDNGKTLCEECHSKTDNYRAKGRKKVEVQNFKIHS